MRENIHLLWRHCVFFCLFTLFVFSASFALQKAPDTPEQHIAAANEMIKQGKYGDAKKELKQALKLNPQSAMAHLLMAVISKHDGNRREALRYTQEALKIEPTNFHAHYLQAVLLYETLQSAKAREEINLAISQGAQFGNAYALKGDLDLEDKMYESALSYYEKALALNVSSKDRTDELREKVDSLKNYIEFKKASKDNPDYSKPQPLNRPSPNYTDDARNNRREGSLRLLVLVDPAGKVQSLLPYTRLGYGLDEEAMKAVRRLKFKPATYKGTPTSYWVVVEVGFSLGR
jgi:TonB family protein